MSLQEIVNNENTSIVDVREPYEFNMGHAIGAINIPLSSSGHLSVIVHSRYSYILDRNLLFG